MQAGVVGTSHVSFADSWFATCSLCSPIPRSLPATFKLTCVRTGRVIGLRLRCYTWWGFAQIDVVGVWSCLGCGMQNPHVIAGLANRFFNEEKAHNPSNLAFHDDVPLWVRPELKNVITNSAEVPLAV